MEAIEKANFRELTAEEVKKYGMKGILVTDSLHPSSKFRWNENIPPGFIVTVVNGKPVTDQFDFAQLLKSNRGLRLSGVHSDGTHDTYYIEEAGKTR
jgi:hypothetical protein